MTSIITIQPTDIIANSRADINENFVALNNGKQEIGSGNLTIYTVAASNSSATDKANANFVCTGTADQVQINTYIASLLASKGGTILLSSGSYNLTSTISIAGDSTSNGPTINIMGAGNSNTLFVPSSGTHAFTISGATQVNIWNIGGTLSGSSDFIHSTAPGSAPYWSFWHSSFKNIFVQGDFSAHSGWVMNLEAPFRSTFENIDGQGVGNGIYLKSTTPNFNPGNSTFLRCFMDLNGAVNGVAYKIHTTDGNGLMNILTFIHCEAIDSKSTSSSSIGWYFVGSTTDYHTTKDITVINSNIEQFNTCVKSAHSVENHVHLSYSDTKTGGIIFDISSDSNGEFYCDSGYVAPSKTTKFLNDANSSTTHPTICGGYSAYIDTGATLSITTTSATVLTKLNATGPGTIPSQFQAYALPANVLLNFYQDETPSGTINGSNTTFTLAHTPSTFALIFINGQLQIGGGVDYTRTGTSIVFVTAPHSGDILRVTYL